MQEDGAPYHRNGWLGQLKSAWDIRILQWPAQSPDLSPIEIVWIWTKNQIGKRKHRVKSWQEMEKVVVEVWNSVPPDLLVKLVNSVPKRLAMVVENKGGPTKY